MSLLLDTPAVAAPRGRLAIHLLRAEMRQHWWLSPAVLAAGLGVWALLAAVTARVPTDARPGGVIFNYAGSLILSLFPVLLSAPLMAGLGATSRLGLWLALPVDRRTVNLLRVVGILLGAWPAALTWPLIISLLGRVYGPVPPWVPVNAGLLVGLGVLLSTRTAAAPFLILLLLPVQSALSFFVPRGRPLGNALADGLATPWTTVGLVVFCLWLAVRLLKSSPPRRG